MHLLKRIRLTMVSENQEKDTSVMENTVKEVGQEQALFDAAESGHCEKIAKLLSLGVSVEAESLKEGLNHSIKHSMTPLHIAAANGHLDCVQMLINHGANVNAKDEFGCTALHLAAKNGNYLCLKTLLEAGADSCARIDTPLYRLEAPYVGNTTPLHFAAANDYPDCVEELIKFGANRDIINERGQTSLFVAARAGFEQCVLTLLQNSHGLACISLPSYETSDTPLHHAVKNRMVKCIKEMVHLGANVNHINRFGFSPLHYLLFTHGRKNDVDMEILKCLVLESCNTNINATTPNGDTALDFALSEPRDEEMAIFLITYGATINRDFQSLALHTELEVPSNLDVLKCLINCMPQLPRLKSVEGNHELHIPVEKEFMLTKIDLEMYVKVPRHEADIIQERLGWINIPPSYSFILYHLHQPTLDIIYERVTEKLKQLENSPVEQNPYNRRLHNAHVWNFLLMKKKLWYERIASKPLTLQHCCRFSIRKAMGPSRLKYITELPLPQRILSYLMFKCDKYDE